jgi:hypothetical protein
VVCNALKHFRLPHQKRGIGPIVFHGNVFINEEDIET